MRMVIFSIIVLSSRVLVAEDQVNFSSPDLQHIYQQTKLTGVRVSSIDFSNPQVTKSKNIVNQLIKVALKSLEDQPLEGLDLVRFNKQEGNKLNRSVFSEGTPEFCPEPTESPDGAPLPIQSLKACTSSWKSFISLFRFASTDILLLKVFGREGKLSDVFFFLTSIYPTSEHLMIRVGI